MNPAIRLLPATAWDPRCDVREADLERDRAEIVSLKERNLKSGTARSFSWIYGNGPYGTARCWLLLAGEPKRAIGAAAVFPRRLSVRGQTIVAGLAGDFSVDSEFRTLGPALKLQRHVASAALEGKEAFRFLYGTPNRLSRPIFRRLGYSRMCSCDRYIRILDARYRYGRYIEGNPTINRLYDLGLRCAAREQRYRRPEGIGVAIPAAFDERFDALWERVRTQYPVLHERTSRCLNWRYPESPVKKYEIFALAKDRRDLLGYIVHHRRDNIARIVDLVADRSGLHMESLLAEFLRFAKMMKAGAVEIRITAPPEDIEVLRRFGFQQPNREGFEYLAMPDPSGASEALAIDESDWYLTAGDTDFEMVE